MQATAQLQAAKVAPSTSRCTARGGSQRSLVVCSAAQPSRRRALQSAAGVLGAALLARVRPVLADDDERKVLVEAPLLQDLSGLASTPSGLKYEDILVGKGASPPKGFQVVCNYVAMTPQGKVFDSSLSRGNPYEFRVGTGDVIPGLDEGVLTMKVGGIRRLYIPGELAFPKGVPAAAGRARVPPSSPVIFDVQLLLVPGLDEEDEE